ncbi:MAG TPA: FG-GAP-like repeat-containing protein, partial [Candidatus Acidoferrales bacterium]|nr:FG-GAP-like repeat-containing protein [Candidatus Acidoferrales bacterium]
MSWWGAIIGRLVAVAFAALVFAVTATAQVLHQSAVPTVPSSAKAAAPSAPPSAQDKSRARKAYDAGRRAEQSGDWKAEFAAYTEAATYDSSNREYAMLKEHARFQVIQSLVDSAERQAIAGNTPAARALLTEALGIDPNYVVARERLAELTPTPVDVQPSKEPRLAGLPRLILTPGTHTFDYRGTTRGAYEEIGKQFGVKMVFDGDLVDRPVRFQVPALDFENAVMVLSLETKTFTRVVDSHTMFITQDTAQKEKDYALEVDKQLLLPASVTTDEMNEAVRMIREMTGITRTQLNTATRTLTVRSTEQNVALAQTLLEQLEQPHGELLLDIEILEVDRSGVTQLGITPPSGTSLFMLTVPEVQQLQAAQNSGSLIQALQAIFGSSAVSSATGSALPALVAFGGGKSIFLATMPGASANFGTALSTVRSAQRVLLRAQDGKPATFFVGDRYPIDLGLLSSDLSSASSALASALASGLSLPRTDYTAGAGTSSVAIADFNRDGLPDLVAANQTDGTLSILFGNGDGTFQAVATTCTAPTCIALPGVVAGTTTTATSPSAVVTGDFNDDGNPDIAVTDMANNRVLILLGKGDGTFLAPVAYATGSSPVALVAQDFDGDGQPDLAVVDQGDGTTASAVSVLVGNKVNSVQDGTFGAKIDYPVGVAPSAITTADFNTDGFADLVVTNKADNTASILLGKGDGTFGTQRTLLTGNGPAGVATADFNNDGHADLAITNETDGTASVILGNGDGTFFTPTVYTAGSSPVGISAANFTGASTDLAVADQAANVVDILINNGDSTFNTPISLPAGNGPVAVAAADLNSDSAIDLVTANNTSGSVSVTLNTLQTSGSSFSSSSSSGQIGYPSAEYVDLGLKVKATPRLHGTDEVTLQLQFDIKNLTGTNINGIPILSNRNIEQTIRLRENETSVLSGMIQTSGIRTSSGLPWTSTVPGIGLLTGEDSSNIQQTELLILVTPRALQFPPHEVPAVYAGRGEPSTPPSGPATGPLGPQNPNQPPVPGRA